jgi:hypothetical protein
MKICKEHWALCREAMDSHGLTSLVSVDGKEAARRAVAELEGDDSNKNFDPLMSMHWHFMNIALECGGMQPLTPRRPSH